MVFFQLWEYSRRDSFNTKYFNSPTCTLHTNSVRSMFLLHPITTATLWDDAIGRTTSGSGSTTLWRTIRHKLKRLRVEPSAPLDLIYIYDRSLIYKFQENVPLTMASVDGEMRQQRTGSTGQSPRVKRLQGEQDQWQVSAGQVMRNNIIQVRAYRNCSKITCGTAPFFQTGED